MKKLGNSGAGSMLWEDQRRFFANVLRRGFELCLKIEGFLAVRNGNSGFDSPMAMFGCVKFWQQVAIKPRSGGLQRHVRNPISDSVQSVVPAPKFQMRYTASVSKV